MISPVRNIEPSFEYRLRLAIVDNVRGQQPDGAMRTAGLGLDFLLLSDNGSRAVSAVPSREGFVSRLIDGSGVDSCLESRCWRCKP